MKFEAARVEGQRVVENLLRRFRQDTGNARWIGRMALSSIEQRFPSFRSHTPETAKDMANEGVENVDATAKSERSASSEGVSPWSILSSTEIIQRLATSSREEVESILADERSNLARASVIDAAMKRLG